MYSVVYQKIKKDLHLYSIFYDTVILLLFFFVFGNQCMCFFFIDIFFYCLFVFVFYFLLCVCVCVCVRGGEGVCDVSGVFLSCVVGPKGRVIRGYSRLSH